MAKNKNMHDAKNNKNDEFSKELIQEIFKYNDGKLYWRHNDVEAGGFNSIGYKTIGLFGKRLLAHRLIYMYHYDKIMDNLSIDHIDGDTTNNHIDNLRAITHQENHFNHTKAKGYSWNKKLKKYSAQIHVGGNKIHLGYFESKEDAHNAYLDAKEIYHKIKERN